MLQARLPEPIPREARDDIWVQIDKRQRGYATEQEFMVWWGQLVDGDDNQIVSAVQGALQAFSQTRRTMLIRWNRQRMRLKIVAYWLIWFVFGVLFVYNPRWLQDVAFDSPAFRSGILYCNPPQCELDLISDGSAATNDGLAESVPFCQDVSADEKCPALPEKSQNATGLWKDYIPVDASLYFVSDSVLIACYQSTCTG